LVVVKIGERADDFGEFLFLKVGKQNINREKQDVHLVNKLVFIFKRKIICSYTALKNAVFFL
jgi:hypothetical protein